MRKIVKRDGRVAVFNGNKITTAIKAAARSVKYEGSEEEFERLTDEVISKAEEKFYNVNQQPTVENMQDIVEEVLVNNNLYEVAKAYMLYREERTQKRERKSNLMEKFVSITLGKESDKVLKNSNGNVSEDTPMGKMLCIGAESSKEFAHQYLLSEEASKAHINGDIHIHDLDFYSTGTLTCQTRDTNIILKDSNGKIINTTIDYFDKEFFQKDNEKPEIYNPKNLFILGRSGWTELEAVSRRLIGKTEPVFHLKTSKDLGLKLTGNHQVPVIRNGEEILLCVKDIKVGDELFAATNISKAIPDTIEYEPNKITEIAIHDYSDYVYDVTTGEHWYIANGYVSHNCCQIDLEKLFEHGFDTGHGHIRTPNSIISAASLACVVIQANQNDQH